MVGVVDVGVIQIAPRTHLLLQALDQFAFADQFVDHADVGDYAEGAGQHAGFVLVRVDRLRDHVDLFAAKRRGGTDEKREFGHLLIVREGRRLEFDPGPAFGRRHARPIALRARRRRQRRKRQRQGSAALQQRSPTDGLRPPERIRIMGHGILPGAWRRLSHSNILAR
ncbi:MAG: hypothetical protein GVX90_04095 [Alphaproteobacteria bacterium]|nr:hypothetical protein [Alphaproteobacteria bacterium]